jgi:hypothetical protein
MVANQTVWGAGNDVRCKSLFTVAIRNWGGVVLGGPLLGQGNVSDNEEPDSLGHWTYPGDVNLTFSNGFTHNNSSNISTCKASASSDVVTSPHFDVNVPVAVGGSRYSISVSLPIQETFHYVFPANFGTWAIDELSASGGPGGGWAFSYTPCP